MANYVTTTVYAKDINILIDKLLRNPTEEELKEDKSLTENSLMLDFEKLIPRPKDLMIIAGGAEWVTNRYNFSSMKQREQEQALFIEPILKKLYRKGMTQAEFMETLNGELALHLSKFIKVYDLIDTLNRSIKSDIENIAKGYYNLRTYGYKNWYEWSYANWGTKWNGSEVNIDGNTAYFQTANGLCLPVLEKLSKYTDLIVCYADEDTGSNYGILEIKNGNTTVLLDDRNKSIGESMACRLEDIDNMDEDYCEENYSDEEMQEYFHTDRDTFIENEKSKFRAIESYLEKVLF